MISLTVTSPNCAVANFKRTFLKFNRKCSSTNDKDTLSNIKKDIRVSTSSPLIHKLYSSIRRKICFEAILKKLLLSRVIPIHNIENLYKCCSDAEKDDLKKTPPHGSSKEETFNHIDYYKRLAGRIRKYGIRKVIHEIESPDNYGSGPEDKQNGTKVKIRSSLKLAIKYMAPFIIIDILFIALMLHKKHLKTLKSYYISWEEFVKSYLLPGNISRIVVLNECRLKVFPTSGVAKYLSIYSKDYFARKMQEVEEQHNYSSPPFPIIYQREGLFEEPTDPSVPFLLISLFVVLFICRKFIARNLLSKMDSINESFSKMFINNISKEASISNIKFSDVIGCDEAKLEIQEFVEFLKNTEKFKKIGARIPRGAILYGPPGTGKTLLAKAVAGESNVPLFFAAGSEFSELFAGSGSLRVRQLFKSARQASPSIIFIDEIDTIGSKRSSAAHYGNTEGAQTLNQLLVELDGFQTDANIILLCGTNRFEVLDEALIRAGRLDRKIHLSPPDFKGRREMFRHYFTKVTVDLEHVEEYSSRLAGLTPGCTGADISTIVNEAAILAVRENQTSISLEVFESAIDRLLLGNKLSKHLNPSEKNIIAVHESGHTLVAWYLENTLPILKVSIIPRGRALGVNQFLPSEDFLMSKKGLSDMMISMLAGRAAEEIIIGDISTGAADDLLKVTEMAYKKVGVYGMDKDIGKLCFPSIHNKFATNTSGHSQSPEYSQILGNEIDKKVREAIETAYATAVNLITEKRDLLEKLVENLKKKETLSYLEIEEILGPRPTGSRTISSVVHQTTASSLQKT